MLVAHLLTILSPAVLVVAAVAYWPTLSAVTAYPALIFVAATLLVIGSVCESAENTQRRWYLTEQQPSLMDWLFNSCIAGFMVAVVITFRGDLWWLTLLALVLLGVYMVAYLVDWPTDPLQGVLGTVYVLTLYAVFRDPVVFLQMLGVFLTVFFYKLLLATRAQSLHGFTTLVNGVGLMALPWAIYNHANGTTLGWWTVGIVIAVTVAVALLLRPTLMRLSPTPRASGPAPEA